MNVPDWALRIVETLEGTTEPCYTGWILLGAHPETPITFQTFVAVFPTHDGLPPLRIIGGNPLDACDFELLKRTILSLTVPERISETQFEMIQRLNEIGQAARVYAEILITQQLCDAGLPFCVIAIGTTSTDEAIVLIYHPSHLPTRLWLMQIQHHVRIVFERTPD